MPAIYKVLFASCLLCILILAIGCKGGSPNPLIPDEGISEQTIKAGGTSLWGFWSVEIEKSTREVKAIPIRNTDLALNVLGFLEPPSLKNLTIDFGTLVINTGQGTVQVDVTLKHPFQTAEKIFNGFDVRGIVFGAMVTNAD